MRPPSKRRKTGDVTTEDIIFDPEARRDYLTGFHKRKLQRTKHAKDVAEKKARAERIEERRKLREERKLDIERHVNEVNALLKPIEQKWEDGSCAGGHDDDQKRYKSPGLVEVDGDAEYIYEDRYTTVTIEAIDLSQDASHQAGTVAEELVGSLDDGEPDRTSNIQTPREGKRMWAKDKPEKQCRTPKRKRIKFRYENKAERKLTRVKEKSKNSRQANARRTG